MGSLKAVVTCGATEREVQAVAWASGNSEGATSFFCKPPLMKAHGATVGIKRGEKASYTGRHNLDHISLKSIMYRTTPEVLVVLKY